MAAITRTRLDVMLERGLLWVSGASTPSLTAGATFMLGFTTGSREIVFLDRSYFSTGNLLFVGLYEASYTGGTTLTAVNRRLSVDRTPPFTMKSGVTATLGSPVASVVVMAAASTGNAQAGLVTESNRYVVKASTPYVIGVRNDASGSAYVGATFNYHELMHVDTWTEN